MEAVELNETDLINISGGAIVYNIHTKKYDVVDNGNVIESYDTYDSAYYAAYMIGCNSDLYNTYDEYYDIMTGEIVY